MDALVEVHTSDEMKRAAACGAKLIGQTNFGVNALALDGGRPRLMSLKELWRRSSASAPRS